MENYKGLVWNVIFESDTHTMIHNTYNEGWFYMAIIYNICPETLHSYLTCKGPAPYTGRKITFWQATLG
jgi:hypothetical protein